MALRKALLSSSAFQDNARSFVNVTSDRLHVRKITGRISGAATDAVLGDRVSVSLDEVPVAQNNQNDSRSHIGLMTAEAVGGTGAISLSEHPMQMEFGRNDLVLDPDEALFMNTIDHKGAPACTMQINIWYES